MLTLLKEFWDDCTPFGKIMIGIFLAGMLFVMLARILIELAPQPARADPRDTCAVQRVLAQKGLYDGEIDCQNGPETRAAIARFQSLVGLPDDGVVGGDTLEALFGRQEAPVGREREPAANEYQPERPVDRADLPECGDRISVKGPIKTTEFWARSAARKLWQTQVGDRYGNKFVRWENARETKIACDPACATCTVRFECTASGVPCQG